MARATTKRRAWQIHAGILALLAVAYILFVVEFMSGPAPRVLDLRAVVATVFLMCLGGYATITSILMIWVRRRIWGPIVMHGLMLGTGLVLLKLDADAASERRAQDELEDALSMARRIENCMQLRELRVVVGEPTRASLHLYNGCADDVEVSGIELTGTSPTGETMVLDEPAPRRFTVPPGGAATVVVEPRWGADVAVDDRSHWRVRAFFSGSDQSGWPCFASPGYPDQNHRCAPLPRVAVDPP
ncbi:hypothetical protein [Nannocystis sp. SCPEA4]|uniref:hypothetical protein n=1 Tax=Nannocystis sp. SCPEA4 TaxID=2996787 RepID=UPI002271FDC0|nr:hypothetical protein [Nannocystis sp. SCPEA4]MCY1054068.1 hypothetical protein [Nannocystis sp. SCPEA4]